MSATRISQEGFITPPQWFGLIERIDIYLSMLWIVVLAGTLLWSERRQSFFESNDVNRGTEGFLK